MFFSLALSLVLAFVSLKYKIFPRFFLVYLLVCGLLTTVVSIIYYFRNLEALSIHFFLVTIPIIIFSSLSLKNKKFR
jgi:hypothetical protein